MVRLGVLRGTTIWFLVGFALLQLAWFAALPPFRGADEVDHVYRASAVAHGDWASEPSSATLGTGALVRADREVVSAARPACLSLEYKGPDDCGAAGASEGEGVPSAAGRYNPVYYALVGYPARGLQGTRAAIVMRSISAALCLGMLAGVVASLSRWAGHRRLLAFGIGMTPTVVYASAVVAPNGLEMMAALGWWAALAGLASDDDPAHEAGYVALGMVSGALLVTLRSMGPFWALGILVVALVAWPSLLPRLRAVVRRPLGAAAVGLGFVTGVASLAWVVAQRSLVVSQEGEGSALSWGFRVVRSLQEVPVWVLQSIAAFPFRNQPAPLFVYPCYLLVLSVLLLLGLRAGSARQRTAVVVTVTASFVLPLVITFVTLDLFGTAWQGRYALPLLLGATVVAGDAWSRSPRLRLSTSAALLAIGMLVAAHAAGVIAVGWRSSSDGEWVTGEGPMSHPPAWSVAVLAIAGAMVLVVPLVRRVWRTGLSSGGTDAS